jgi:hypothetical protein
MKSRAKFQRNGNKAGNWWDTYDLFRQPMVAHNMEGAEEIGTSIGGICSAFLLLTVLAYATPKFILMWTRG